MTLRLRLAHEKLVLCLLRKRDRRCEQQMDLEGRLECTRRAECTERRIEELKKRLGK